jgi:tetratricopeptide (TPR) repeat protein
LLAGCAAVQAQASRKSIWQSSSIGLSMATHLEEIHLLLESDDYATAKEKIAEARAAGEQNALLTLFEALCVYEAGDDFEALRLLTNFLVNAESDEKRPYARFTAAVCLENLGLNEQALEVLEGVPKSYPGLEKEIKQVRKELDRQRHALQLFSEILSSSIRH